MDRRSAGTGLGYKDLFWQVGFQRECWAFVCPPPKTYVALAPTLATLPPRADALKGMAKPLE